VDPRRYVHQPESFAYFKLVFSKPILPSLFLFFPFL
jgi:hypothetical protein